ncbi:RNA polymerase subunit sigma-70 [Paractinoplanes rishiriensis]|uniref:DNA-directed RNA polymerase sigma-70 factor n=1 Tax=Paractinoplanes rishiriensis TaxID=1050105 RepID=A0A919JX03_9ACTN|nr:RNA polymerase subunit sigma-70 [Actinoplanes rishiriensis]GIE95080.1 DNA-directed RNA polymerase sigma-70 factor [Actinoplanes rishiriensis]
MTVQTDQDGLAALRGELVGYAYRMLGSPFEAEDAAQETLLRAWRHLGDYDPARGSLRTWVYRIATNVCLDMLRSAQRRARATDFASTAAPGGDLGPPLPETTWVLPILDRDLADPADVAERRETVRLAFVAALQHLPPKQRAVLILRDVLCWPAAEVATLLDTSVASVTSALQRARAALRAAGPGRPSPLSDPAKRSLVERYADAFQRHDVAALVALLHSDVVTSMPPFTWWLRGRDVVGAVMSASDACLDDRLTLTAANGSFALRQERPAGPGGALEPFALLVFEFGDELITEVTTFLGFRADRAPRG